MTRASAPTDESTTTATSVGAPINAVSAAVRNPDRPGLGLELRTAVANRYRVA